MYLGRYKLGEFLPLTVWCRTAALAPALPVTAPVAMVYSDSSLVTSFKMPIRDRYVVTGFFQHALRLDGRFGIGHYQVVYNYITGSVAKGQVDSFEIVAGGHADGMGISLYYCRRPTSDFFVLHCDGGRVVRRRNPRLT